MAKKFSGENLDRAVYLANVMYHDGQHTIAAIARRLKCSWNSADKLITYSRDKWDQRQELAGALPLHFDECFATI